MLAVGAGIILVVTTVPDPSATTTNKWFHLSTRGVCTLTNSPYDSAILPYHEHESLQNARQSITLILVADLPSQRVIDVELCHKRLKSPQRCRSGVTYVILVFVVKEEFSEARRVAQTLERRVHATRRRGSGSRFRRGATALTNMYCRDCAVQRALATQYREILKQQKREATKVFGTYQRWLSLLTIVPRHPTRTVVPAASSILAVRVCVALRYERRRRIIKLSER